MAKVKQYQIITEAACLEAALLKQNTVYSKFRTEVLLFKEKVWLNSLS
jgi:hypothetical protein